MKALDTNILVRWITRDDPIQTPIADTVLSEPFFVPLTVLIETIWVLGGRTYRYTPAMVRAAIDTLLLLETATIAGEDWIRWAIERAELGADLPDMIHIIASRGASAFVSFEKDLSSDAGENTPLSIVYPA